MKPPSGSNSLSSNPASNGHSPSPPGSATVPLKVYRELAAELQATKAMLDSLHTQNQQLSQQNQQMRQEADRLVQSALTLQQLMMGSASSKTPLQHLPTDVARTQAEALAAQIRPHRVSAPTAPSATYLPEPDTLMEPLLSEQSVSPFSSQQSSSSREIGGIWLWLIVISIIATAFAAGFLLVKPLLPNNR